MSCFVIYFILTGTIIYKMDIMLYEKKRDLKLAWQTITSLGKCLSHKSSEMQGYFFHRLLYSPITLYHQRSHTHLAITKQIKEKNAVYLPQFFVFHTPSWWGIKLKCAIDAQTVGKHFKNRLSDFLLFVIYILWGRRLTLSLSFSNLFFSLLIGGVIY